MENNQALLLFDQLAQVAKHLAEFEFHIATQNALSDRLETLVKQQADFQTFTKSFFMNLPFIKDVLKRTNDYCSNELNRNKEDLVINLNEASLKLKLVNIYQIFFVKKKFIFFNYRSVNRLTKEANYSMNQFYH